ncbi:acidic proline-rich protein PRP25-like, partial [Chelydra serpentina]
GLSCIFANQERLSEAGGYLSGCRGLGLGARDSQISSCQGSVQLDAPGLGWCLDTCITHSLSPCRERSAPAALSRPPGELGAPVAARRWLWLAQPQQALSLWPPALPREPASLSRPCCCPLASSPGLRAPLQSVRREAKVPGRSGPAPLPGCSAGSPPWCHGGLLQPFPLVLRPWLGVAAHPPGLWVRGCPAPSRARPGGSGGSAWAFIIHKQGEPPARSPWAAAGRGVLFVPHRGGPEPARGAPLPRRGFPGRAPLRPAARGRGQPQRHLQPAAKPPLPPAAGPAPGSAPRSTKPRQRPPAHGSPLHGPSCSRLSPGPRSPRRAQPPGPSAPRSPRPRGNKGRRRSSSSRPRRLGPGSGDGGGSAMFPPAPSPPPGARP